MTHRIATKERIRCGACGDQRDGTKLVALARDPRETYPNREYLGGPIEICDQCVRALAKAQRLQCPNCKGTGEVSRSSFVDASKTRQVGCSPCHGRGHLVAALDDGT